jgi:AcrR family transcriptional regulator
VVPARSGLRERGKLEKRERIRAAARELFSSQGFEAATLRQIAERAEVALGTLFNYARDKRDLTFLLFNDDLSRLVDEAIAASARERHVFEQVLAIWRPHYRFYARSPALCRILLRDMYFYSEGHEAQRFHAVERRLRDHLLAVVAAAQREGQLASSASAEDIAALLFFVFEGSVRSWMHEEEPEVETGLSTLRKRLSMQLRAFAPEPAAASNAAAGSKRSAYQFPGPRVPGERRGRR